MVEKTNAPRGRPITNKIDPIPASAEKIAKAIFKAADKKIVKTQKAPKRKPN